MTTNRFCGCCGLPERFLSVAGGARECFHCGGGPTGDAAPGEPTAAERLAVVTAERDALAAAVREVAESEGALETMIDDSGWTLDDERIAEERVAAAHAALDAALAAAEGR